MERARRWVADRRRRRHGGPEIAGINAGHRWEELVVKLLPRLGMHRSSVPAARWRTAVRLAAIAALAGGLLTAGAAPAQAALLEEHAPATYNMQGSQGGDLTPKWSTDIPALLANHDVLALQQAGPVPPQSQNGPFVYVDSTTNGGTPSITTCVTSAPAAARSCGTSTSWRPIR